MQESQNIVLEKNKVEKFTHPDFKIECSVNSYQNSVIQV